MYIFNNTITIIIYIPVTLNDDLLNLYNTMKDQG